MSQLVQLKSRIDAITTIRKITSAMRIISMSLHSKLGHQVTNLNSYENELKEIFSIVNTLAKKNIHEKNQNNTPLVIIIGSDKGLCGGFNSGIVHMFKKSFDQHKVEILTVGKKVKDLLKSDHEPRNIENVNYKRISQLTDEIINFIQEKQYSNVTLLYNEAKSFFVQRPKINHVLPVKIDTENNDNANEYVWDASPEELHVSLKNEYIRFTIKKALFESMFSEQAARFRSMDNANRSAEGILEDMKMQYSKLRQTKITGELTELSSHF